MIPTKNRLNYAAGFLELGLIEEASNELAAIPEAEKASPEAISARADCCAEAKDWEQLTTVAPMLVLADPADPHGWLHWAHALRELNRVDEAKGILLEAVLIHHDCAAVHYHLACYDSLLGNFAPAWRRLKTACELGPEWRLVANSDPDLTGLRVALRR